MRKFYPFTPLLLALLLVVFSACAPLTSPTPSTAQPATPTTAVNPPANQPSTAVAPTTASSFTDPFAYCAAVGNIDTPDSRFSGPHMPDVLAQGLKKASGASADAPIELFTTGAYWRCMDDKVYACTVGANLPCDSKANTDKTPTQPETDFCVANPTSDFIPAAVTGHDTIYSWKCTAGKPAIDQQVFHVDARGYIVEIWYVIPHSQ
jgi:hypothetical protein